MRVKKHPFWSRLYASFTVFFFLLNSVLVVPSGTAIQPVSENYSPRPVKVLNLSSLQLPSGLGSIDEVFQPEPEKRNSQTVILIQDAHAVPSAQQSILELIDHFQTTYNLSLIAVEGAEGRLEPDLFRAFPDRGIAEQIFKHYLDEAELSGAAAASILNRGEAVYFGVEDIKSYQENVIAFHQASEFQNELLFRVRELEKSVQALKKEVYSEELLFLDQSMNQFRDQNDFKSLDFFFKKYPPVAADFQHLYALMGEWLAAPPPAPVKQEITALTDFARISLGKTEEREKFNRTLQAYQTEQLSEGAFLFFLEEILREQGIPLRLSERLTALKKRHELFRQIKGPAFYREFLRYEAGIKARLIRTEEERQLDSFAQVLGQLQKLVCFELTREEWEELQASFLANSSDSRGHLLAGKFSQLKKDLSEKYADYLNFYQTAMERDQSLAKNLIRVMAQKGRPQAVFIGGGFHTDGLKKFLKNQNIAYALISPAVHKLPEVSRYDALMRGDVSWQNYLSVEDGQVNLLEAFSRAAADKLSAEFVEKNGEESLSLLLRTWRENLVRRLAGQARLSEAGRYTKFIDALAVQKNFREAKNPIKTLWDQKIRSVITKLQTLYTQHQWTEPNILRALSWQSVMPAAAEPLTARPQPAALFPALRSELRSEPGAAAKQKFGKWRLLEELKTALRDLSPEIVQDLRTTQDAGARKRILEEAGIPHVYEVDGKFLASAIEDLLRQQPESQKPKNVSKKLRWGGEGRFLVAFTNDVFHFIIKTYHPDRNIPSTNTPVKVGVQKKWLADGWELARDRLEGLAAPTMVIDASDSTKKVKMFAYLLEGSGVRKTDIAIVQKKIIPLLEHLKILTRRGDIEAAKRLMDQYKAMTIAMFRRGVIDTDFGGTLANYGVDPETGDLYVFDYGDLSAGMLHAYELVDYLEDITNRYIIDSLRSEVSDEIGDYFENHPFKDADFYGADGKFLFAADWTEENKATFQMTFPHSEEEIRTMFLNHSVSEIPEAARSELRSDISDSSIELTPTIIRKLFADAVGGFRGKGFPEDFITRLERSADQVENSSLEELIVLYQQLVQNYRVENGTGAYEDLSPEELWKDNGSWRDLLGNQLSPLSGYLELAQGDALAPAALTDTIRDSLTGSVIRVFTLIRLEEVLGDAAQRKELERLYRERQQLSWGEQHAPELKDYTVVSSQMEAGLDRGFLERIGSAVKYVAQTTLTGGLGALMHDLLIAWAKNGVHTIGINVIYDRSKGQYFSPGIALEDTPGDVLRKKLKKTDIHFSFRLKAGDNYKKLAERVGSKAAGIINRDIQVDVFELRTRFTGTPLYYLDAYYLDAQGNRINIFDEVYPDEDRDIGEGKKVNLWRDVHMAVYGHGRQLLVRELKKRGLVKKNLIFIDNEVFVSTPTPLFPDAIHHHINHTVYRPGLYQPSEASFEMLGFPEYMRRYIVRDGKISITDAVAIESDLITGVGIYEHTPVLGQDIFAAFRHKLLFYNHRDQRNTNGALFDQWEAPERRALINRYKIAVGLSPAATDRRMYARLEKGQPLKEKFKEENEWISAAYQAEFLSWMKTDQEQPLWHDQAMTKIEERLKEKGLLAEGETPMGLQEFSAFVLAHLGEKDWPSPGSSDYQRFEICREVLLEKPIVSNIRRQVPYKGPDKWIEILENLRAHPELIDDFRKHSPRIVIGGRVFDDGAQGRFNYIKRLVQELGLQDTITTIENYNIYDAPLIFRAVSATVMLSDEFLEASATSMMKAVINGGALIGVWGGAMPELFVIRKTETGKELDVFADKLTHDEVVRRRDAGELKITNGFLVNYGYDRSSQRGGGRRPDAQSLVQALRGVQEAYQTSETRRDLQWNVLTSAYRVDMERGQARAHIGLWKQIVQEKERRRKFFSQLTLSVETARKLLAIPDQGFKWQKKPDPGGTATQTVVDGQPGFLGFVEGYRLLQALGVEAIFSITQHAANTQHTVNNGERVGDVFNYILNHLFREEDPALAPFRNEIEALAIEASKQTDVEAKVPYELRALDLLNELSLYVSWELLKGYAQGNEELGDYFKDPRIVENLVRFLDKHAVEMPTTSGKIKSYAVTLEEESVVVSVNTGEYLFDQRREPKARAVLQPFPETLSLLFGSNQQNPLTMYQVRDYATGDTYDAYTIEQIQKKGLRLGIPANNVQVLQLSPISVEAPEQESSGEAAQNKKLLLRILSSAVRGEFINGQLAEEKLQESIKELRDEPEKLRMALAALTELEPSLAKENFQAGLQAVMAFISFLEPSLLTNMRFWDKGVYKQLSKVYKQSEVQAVFQTRTFEFYETQRKTGIVLSRSSNGIRIILALHFPSHPFSVSDGKTWFGVTHPAALGIEPGGNYSVYDLLAREEYGPRPSDEILSKGLEFGVPIQDRHGKESVHFQVLRLTPARSELRGQTPATKSVLNLEPLADEVLFSLAERGAVTSEAVSEVAALPAAEVNRFLQTLERRALEEGNLFDESFARENLLPKAKTQQKVLLAAVERYLNADPDRKLRFSWVMTFENRPVDGMVRDFLNALADLRQRFSDRIDVQTAMIVPGQHQTAYDEFLKNIRNADSIETIETGSLQAGSKLNTFLTLHPQALVYGESSLLPTQGIQGDFKSRLVQLSGLNMEEGFPVFSALSFITAKVESGVHAELLRQIPEMDIFQGRVAFRQGRLTILEAARFFVFEAQMARHIATMA